MDFPVPACNMTVNQSVGLIDVTNKFQQTVFCNWTIGNTGLEPAVALFLIQEIQLGCRYLH